MTSTRLSHSLSSQGHIFSTPLKACHSACQYFFPGYLQPAVISDCHRTLTAAPALLGHLIPARNASSVLALQLGFFPSATGHLVVSAPYPVPRACHEHVPR